MKERKRRRMKRQRRQLGMERSGSEGILICSRVKNVDGGVGIKKKKKEGIETN